MTDQTTRRRVLATLPVLCGFFAGCAIRRNGKNSYRGLSIELHNVSRTDEQYEIVMNPEVGVGGDWEPFRNVSVVATNGDGEVLCRQSLGDLTEPGNHERVTLACSGFPHTITYEIEGDPCSQDTTVTKIVYDPEQEEWLPEDVECNS